MKLISIVIYLKSEQTKKLSKSDGVRNLKTQKPISICHFHHRKNLIATAFKSKGLFP